MGERGRVASNYSIGANFGFSVIRCRAAACGRTSPAGPLASSHSSEVKFAEAAYAVEERPHPSAKPHFGR